MSMNVQGVTGMVHNPTPRDWSPARQRSTLVDVDRDRFTPAARDTAANPYDQVIDKLRTAALRRDAALVRSSATPKGEDPTEDAALLKRERGGATKK
jgi:hypothetical protein